MWFTLMSPPLEVDVSVRNLGDYYKLMAEFFFFFGYIITNSFFQELKIMHSYFT